MVRDVKLRPRKPEERHGPAGREVKGVYDPLDGLARPPQGIAIQTFLRECLCGPPSHSDPADPGGAGPHRKRTIITGRVTPSAHGVPRADRRPIAGIVLPF